MTKIDLLHRQNKDAGDDGRDAFLGSGFVEEAEEDWDDGVFGGFGRTGEKIHFL